MLPSYRNQSIDLLIETSQLICTANQLTGFYMTTTRAINGLKLESKFGDYPVEVSYFGVYFN